MCFQLHFLWNASYSFLQATPLCVKPSEPFVFFYKIAHKTGVFVQVDSLERQFYHSHFLDRFISATANRLLFFLCVWRVRCVWLNDAKRCNAGQWSSTVGPPGVQHGDAENRSSRRENVKWKQQGQQALVILLQVKRLRLELWLFCFIPLGLQLCASGSTCSPLNQCLLKVLLLKGGIRVYLQNDDTSKKQQDESTGYTLFLSYNY